AAAHLGDFLGKIVHSLLQALALLVADKANHFNLTAQLLGHGGDVLGNRLVGVLDKSLFQQAVFLIELADSSHDHLLGDVGGLALIDGLRPEDFLFLLQHVGRHLLFVQVGGVGRGNLHADILGKLGKAGLVCTVGLEIAHDADAAAAVNIGLNHA